MQIQIPEASYSVFSSGLRSRDSMFRQAGEGERVAILRQTPTSDQTIPANPEHPLWIGCCGSFKNDGHVLLDRNDIFTVSLVIKNVRIFPQRVKCTLYTDDTTVSIFSKSSSSICQCIPLTAPEESLRMVLKLTVQLCKALQGCVGSEALYFLAPVPHPASPCPLLAPGS